MTSAIPSAQVRIHVGDLVLPSPFKLTLYYLGKSYNGASAEGSRRRTGGRRLRKKYPAAKNIMRRRNNNPEQAPVGQKNEKKSQCRKLSHSTENTKSFYIARYPLPKTERYRLSYYITEAIPYLSILASYLNTLTNLYPILIHCRIYTLS